jgi:hypothetical protein
MKAILFLMIGLALQAETRLVVWYDQFPPVAVPVSFEPALMVVAISAEKVQRFEIEVRYEQAGESKVERQTVVASCSEKQCTGAAVVRGAGIRFRGASAAAVAVVGTASVEAAQ